MRRARGSIAALHRTFAILAAIGVVSTPAFSPLGAREVDRQEVAEVFALDAPQERRIYCRDTKMFTLDDGTEYRACVDWRAQNRTRLIRTYAALDGPDEDIDQNLAIALDCFDLAVASQNDPDRETFDDKPFLAGTRQHFALCAQARELQRTNQYKISVYETGVWVGGR